MIGCRCKHPAGCNRLVAAGSTFCHRCLTNPAQCSDRRDAELMAQAQNILSWSDAGLELEGHDWAGATQQGVLNGEDSQALHAQQNDGWSAVG